MESDFSARHIRAAQRGSIESFNALYDALFPGLYAYVAASVPTRQDAEDIVSEAWLIVVRQIRQFRGDRAEAFTAWVYTIARRLIAGSYRRAEPVESIPPEDLDLLRDNELSPLQIMENVEQVQRVREAINALSERRREIVVLRYFGGLRNREIARVLALDERTVASHLSRALDELRVRLPKGLEAYEY